MKYLASVAVTIGIVSFGGSTLAAQRGQVTLPVAPSEIQNQRTNIVLRLSPSGLPSINDQQVAWERLPDEVKAIFEHRPDKVLLVQRLRSTRDEDLRKVLTIAKKYGVRVYKLPARG